MDRLKNNKLGLNKKEIGVLSVALTIMLALLIIGVTKVEFIRTVLIATGATILYIGSLTLGIKYIWRIHKTVSSLKAFVIFGLYSVGVVSLPMIAYLDSKDFAIIISSMFMMALINFILCLNERKKPDWKLIFKEQEEKEKMRLMMRTA